MANFTIRVVLHDNATWDDYTRLASALAARNITDVITADNGARYKMPPAEYQCHGNLTAVDVRGIVESAAGTIGKPFGVLVTEGNTRAWSRLAPA